MISGAVGAPGLPVVSLVATQEAQERDPESVSLVQVEHHPLYHVVENLKKVMLVGHLMHVLQLIVHMGSNTAQGKKIIYNFFCMCF